jgi:serine protease AprX
MRRRGVGERASALWGKKGGRSRLGALVVACALLAPAAANADDGKGGSGGDKLRAVVPSALVAAAQADPDQTFRVIVQGEHGKKSSDVADDVSSENGRVRLKYGLISGVSAEITGKQLLKLATHPHVAVITPDVPAETTGYQSNEVWRQTTHVDQLWSLLNPLTGLLGPAPQAPAIAVIDSGIDTSKAADFGTRIVAAVDFTGAGPADQNGHGTMVAGLAAGASATFPGVAKNAPIVSVRAANADGQLYTSDIIAAADWVNAHRTDYNIRVTNFSLRTGSPTTFRYDPLDQAVEKLWLNGVVVVAAAGNFGTGSAVRMPFAPGNDPFVITVGATDTHGTPSPSDDTVPTWSAYGKTADGFKKPDLAAPGRWIVGPVPDGSTLLAHSPDRVVAPGYMWMSGTSLAAPIVAGAAAQILARHPDWTPNQVKGALLTTATRIGTGAGKGELDAAKAAALTSPPVANRGLLRYVTSSGFDQSAWAADAKAGKFVADWLEADWLEADWLATDWLATDWLATDWLATDWLQTDWME